MEIENLWSYHVMIPCNFSTSSVSWHMSQAALHFFVTFFHHLSVLAHTYPFEMIDSTTPCTGLAIFWASLMVQYIVLQYPYLFSCSFGFPFVFYVVPFSWSCIFIALNSLLSLFAYNIAFWALHLISYSSVWNLLNCDFISFFDLSWLSYYFSPHILIIYL